MLNCAPLLLLIPNCGTFTCSSLKKQVLKGKRTHFWVKILFNGSLYLEEVQEKSREINIRKKIFMVTSEHRRLLSKTVTKTGLLLEPDINTNIRVRK